MAAVSIPVVVLPHGEGLTLPCYQTPLSAGMDLRAAITDDLVLSPNRPTLVPTGLALAIPAGYEGQVRPRSGLAYRNGISIPNSLTLVVIPEAIYSTLQAGTVGEGILPPQ